MDDGNDVDRPRERVCRWLLDSSCEVWHTDCGRQFVSNLGGPEDFGYRFCPYCGGRLEEGRGGGSAGFNGTVPPD